VSGARDFMWGKDREGKDCEGVRFSMAEVKQGPSLNGEVELPLRQKPCILGFRRTRKLRVIGLGYSHYAPQSRSASGAAFGVLPGP
jgi:hypothetical protein